MVEISIIVPVYNKVHYLPVILEMIAAQSFADFECILVDDGSSDGSESVCDRFADRDGRFRVIHLENGGVSNARNMGLNQAMGRYITFVDADDTVHQQYLENLYNCITNYQVDLVISGVMKVWKNSEKKQILKCPLRGKMPFTDALDTFAEVQRDTGIYGICVAKIFSRNLMGEERFDTELSLAEDFDFFLKLYHRVSLVYFDDKAYYYYLQEAENSFAQVMDYQIDYFVQLKIQLRLKKFLEKNNQYSGKNKEIVERRMESYIYYTLFYSECDEFNSRFENLYKIYCLNRNRLLGKNVRQKILLWLLKNNQRNFAKYLVSSYHWIRKIVRKG